LDSALGNLCQVGVFEMVILHGLFHLRVKQGIPPPPLEFR
jgi:hypothetical protein